jgi:hypothetical protein
LEPQQGCSFVFGAAPPDSVRLTYAKCMCQAFVHDGAGLADLFGPDDTLVAGRVSFIWRMEKIRDVHAAAGCLELPFPQLNVGPGKASKVGHDGC